LSTVLAQNYSQSALMVGESQQINADFWFIGNASCCIRMSYAIPFIVVPYMVWVCMKPNSVKEKKMEDTIKWLQNVNFFFQWKLMWKDLLLNISEFPVQKYANKLINHKTEVTNFLVLVFKVLVFWSYVSRHPINFHIRLT